MLKKILNSLLLLGALSTASPQDSTSVKAELTYAGKYIYQGQELSRRGVLQPSIDFVSGNLEAYLFANYDFAGKAFNEEDIVIEYAIPLNDDIEILLDYTHLRFDHSFYMRSHEAYIGIAAEGIGFKATGLVGRLWYDYGDSKESFDELYFSFEKEDPYPVNIGIQKTLSTQGIYIEGSAGVPLILGLEAEIASAYNHKYWTEYDGFTHIQASIRYPLEIAGLTVTPAISYIHAFDKESIGSGAIGILKIEKEF